jgi:two-component system sensor histidine kinase DesK
MQPGAFPGPVSPRVPSPRLLAAYVTVMATLTTAALLASLLYGKVVNGHSRPEDLGSPILGLAVLLALYPWLEWKGLMRRAAGYHRVAVLGMLVICTALMVADGQTWLMTLTVPVALFGVVLTPSAVAAVVGAAGVSLVAGAYGLASGWDWPPVLLACAYLPMTAFSGAVTMWFCHVVEELRQARADLAGRAVGEERQRFARDLHDVLGHSLQAIALRAELAERLIDRDPGRVAKELTEIQGMARGAVHDVREVVRGYRATSLRTELDGMTAVLHAAGIRCETPVIPPDLPGHVHETLGWVARESATNVLRHSAATWCLLTVWADDGRVRLEIVNDGAPGSPGAGPPGSGLAGLTERLAAAGGAFTAEPVGDGTFRVAASVPLTRQEQEPA